jgi:UPF0755 protein
MFKKLIAASLLALTIAGIVLFVSMRSLYAPIENLTEPALIDVTVGSSLSRVTRTLDEAGLLQSPLLFNLLARFRGVENSIKAGEYELEPGLSPASLLDKLVQGDSLQYRITLVEGWTFREALEAIWRSEKVLVSLREASLADIAELMDLDTDNPEGLLYPDTYFYTAGTSDLDILKKAHTTLNNVLDSEWNSRLGALPIDNRYQALILASIIEKESAAASERGHIAGVFVRRLETGMRLQSDPTVIYGMGAVFDGNIRREDLRATTPYNTYRINGLPPTPIALAGVESIHASLNPLLSDYLYFVAKGDGSHYFSSSLKEHNEAVGRFQLRPNSQ